MPLPPVTSTEPSPSTCARWQARGVLSGGSVCHLLVATSKTWTAATADPLLSVPPITNSCSAIRGTRRNGEKGTAAAARGVSKICAGVGNLFFLEAKGSLEAFKFTCQCHSGWQYAYY